jgi:hypothetical protein
VNFSDYPRIEPRFREKTFKEVGFTYLHISPSQSKPSNRRIGRKRP